MKPKHQQKWAVECKPMENCRTRIICCRSEYVHSFYDSCPLPTAEAVACGSGKVTKEAMCRLRPPCFGILSAWAPDHDVRRCSELSAEVAVCSCPDEVLSPELAALCRPGFAPLRCAGLAAAVGWPELVSPELAGFPKVTCGFSAAAQAHEAGIRPCPSRRMQSHREGGRQDITAGLQAPQSDDADG